MIISMDVIFDETTIPCKILNSAGPSIDDEQTKKVYEVQFEVETENKNEDDADNLDPDPDSYQSHNTPIQSDKDSDIEQQQSISRSNQKVFATTWYLLTRDRAKRVRRPNSKYNYADIVAYALVAYQDLVENEPKSYIEAIKCNQLVKWQQAMREEM